MKDPETEALWDAIKAFGKKHGKPALFRELATLLVAFIETVGSTHSTAESDRWVVEVRLK